MTAKQLINELKTIPPHSEMWVEVKLSTQEYTSHTAIVKTIRQNTFDSRIFYITAVGRREEY